MQSALGFAQIFELHNGRDCDPFTTHRQKTNFMKIIIDLGDISKSRRTEMILPLWMNLFSMYGHPHFGLKVVHP